MTLGFDVYLVVSGGERELDRALRALAVAPAGRVGAQARWKDVADAVVVERARRLVAAAGRAPVLVSGRPDLALEAGAGGVHLPESAAEVADARASLGGGALVGASVHDAAGLARRRGADFVVLGPVGEVPGKSAPLDEATFRALVRGAPMPVFALGGVRTADDVRRARALGAHGIAVQRAILESDEPETTLAILLEALGQ